MNSDEMKMALIHDLLDENEKIIKIISEGIKRRNKFVLNVVGKEALEKENRS